MRLLLALLLLIPFVTQAQVHRGHALENLVTLPTNAKYVAGGLRHVACVRLKGEYQRPAGLSDADAAFLKKHVDGACLQAKRVYDDIIYIQSLLEDPAMTSYTLIDIRRLINKPWKYDPVTGAQLRPESTLYRLGILGHHMQYVIGFGYSDRWSKAVIGHQKTVWEQMDFTLWHINDAIIEELYTPEAFK